MVPGHYHFLKGTCVNFSIAMACFFTYSMGQSRLKQPLFLGVWVWQLAASAHCWRLRQIPRVKQMDKKFKGIQVKRDVFQTVRLEKSHWGNWKHKEVYKVQREFLVQELAWFFLFHKKWFAISQSRLETRDWKKEFSFLSCCTRLKEKKTFPFSFWKMRLPFTILNEIRYIILRKIKNSSARPCFLKILPCVWTAYFP